VKLPVLSIEGKELRTVEVDDSVFGIEPNGAVLHQTYVRQRANQRAGTASTKTRGEVQGSTRKIRKQKYTGRARAGSERSPTRVGGGTVFGPRPRDYSQDMPKKMRRLGIRSALSSKVADGQLVVVDQLSMDAPKTKEMARILGNVGFKRSALVVTAQSERAILASVRNLMKTKTLPAAYLNVADMMNHQGLLITEEAVRIAEGLWGLKSTGKRAPRREATAETKTDAPKPRRRASAASLAEPEAVAPAPEPEAKAPAPEPETKATTVEAAPKPKRAAKPKPEAPKAEASTEDKPKRAPRAKKAEAATPAAEDAPKPKRAPRAKKEGE